MATITEDYISFETAKLLKKKGFSLPSTNFEDWLCCMYDENGNIQWGCYHSDYYARVTLQMAMKWLREVHNLQIQIAPITSKHKDWTFGIYKEFSPLTIDLLCFPTYEQSCEAAIKYCLEHLI